MFFYYSVLLMLTNVQFNLANGHVAILSLFMAANAFSAICTGQTHKKGKEEYLYSAFYILSISQSAQAWITQFYLQIHHACLSFICIHQMAPPLTEVRDI